MLDKIERVFLCVVLLAGVSCYIYVELSDNGIINKEGYERRKNASDSILFSILYNNDNGDGAWMDEMEDLCEQFNSVLFSVTQELKKNISKAQYDSLQAIYGWEDAMLSEWSKYDTLDYEIAQRLYLKDGKANIEYAGY